jgi:hypothetical protein
VTHYIWLLYTCIRKCKEKLKYFQGSLLLVAVVLQLLPLQCMVTYLIPHIVFLLKNNMRETLVGVRSSSRILLNGHMLYLLLSWTDLIPCIAYRCGASAEIGAISLHRIHCLHLYVLSNVDITWYQVYFSSYALLQLNLVIYCLDFLNLNLTLLFLSYVD